MAPRRAAALAAAAVVIVLASPCALAASNLTTSACASLGPGVAACWTADAPAGVLTVTAAFDPPNENDGQERLAWAALGLSELGGMAGADIWELTRSNQADAAPSLPGGGGRVASARDAPFWQVTDAHAPGFEPPVRDASQDVTLSAWAEGKQAARELWLSSGPVKAVTSGAALAPSGAANSLVVVLKRRLETCDAQDDTQLRYGRPLFWIWARGAMEEEGEDAKGPTSVSYHGPDWRTRGAALATPWGPQPSSLPSAPPPARAAAAKEAAAPPPASAAPSLLLPKGTKSFDVTIGGDLLLPAGEETVYAVRAVRLPTTSGGDNNRKKRHAVAYAPLFREPFVHHAVLYACSAEAAASLERRFAAAGNNATATNGGGSGGAVRALSPDRAASEGELRARSGGGGKKGGERLRWRPAGGSANDAAAWRDVLPEESGTAEGGPTGANATFSGCMRFWALGAPSGGGMKGHGNMAATMADDDADPPLAFAAPAGTGIPFGGPAKDGKPAWWPTHLLLEMHYNNPSGVGGLVDRNSGMRIYYADDDQAADLTDLGLLTNAQFALAIPPGRASFTAPASVCSAACTRRALGKSAPNGVTIVGRTYHMHGIGKASLTRRFRSSSSSSSSSGAPPSLAETPPISELRAYDYNLQAFLPPIRDGVSERILPGDAMLTTWTFDSSSRNATTRFGPATRDEMAFDWIMYYPAVPELSSCLSMPLRAMAKAILERAAAGGGAGGVPGRFGGGGGNGGGNGTAAPAAATPKNSTTTAQDQKELQAALATLPETLAICSGNDEWGAELFGGLAAAARRGGKAGAEEVAALVKRLYASGEAVPAYPDPMLVGGGAAAAGKSTEAGARPGGGGAASSPLPQRPLPGVGAPKACSSERPL